MRRGGLKLEERALDEFDIDPTGLTALDAGLSTGGFTDCMLQRGATKVYGVDVGYGQVAEKVRVDPRVVVMERTNLRYLQPSRTSSTSSPWTYPSSACSRCSRGRRDEARGGATGGAHKAAVRGETIADWRKGGGAGRESARGGDRAGHRGRGGDGVRVRAAR